MKRSRMEKEMQELLWRPGAYLVLPEDMTLQEAASMGPTELLAALVESRKPKEGWESEELPRRIYAGQYTDRWCLAPEGQLAFPSGADGAVYEAAADAYNRVQDAGGPDEAVVVNIDLYDQLCERAADAHRRSHPLREYDQVTIPREVVAAYENLRKFFFGSGV